GAMLGAVSRSARHNVKKDSAGLDKPVSSVISPQPFKVKKASASRVAQLLQNFYAGRFNNNQGSGETTGGNLIRFTYDDSSNTVWVQAAPADMAQIQQLIWSLDNMTTDAKNELRIFRME